MKRTVQQIKSKTPGHWQLAAEHIARMHAECPFTKQEIPLDSLTHRLWCPLIARAILGCTEFHELFTGLPGSCSMPTGTFRLNQLVLQMQTVFRGEYDKVFTINTSKIFRDPVTNTQCFHQNVELAVLEVLESHKHLIEHRHKDILEQYSDWKLSRLHPSSHETNSNQTVDIHPPRPNSNFFSKDIHRQNPKQRRYPPAAQSPLPQTPQTTLPLIKESLA